MPKKRVAQILFPKAALAPILRESCASLARAAREQHFGNRCVFGKVFSYGILYTHLRVCVLHIKKERDLQLLRTLVLLFPDLFIDISCKDARNAARMGHTSQNDFVLARRLSEACANLAWICFAQPENLA